MNRLLFIGLLACFAVEALCADTAAPPLVNYQGLLTDENGAAIPDGFKKLEFNLYDAALGGNRVWGPQVFASVPVVNGRFNVILGTTDTTGRSIAAAFAAAQRFLGFKVAEVGADLSMIAEVSPRQQVLSAPYALAAESAAKLNGKVPSWYTPVGAIVAFWGTVAPDGWLLCNGGSIPAGSQYDNLRGLVGSTVPDLRGMFLRGLNLGRSDGWQDPDGASRNLGNLQSDNVKSHNHGISLYHYTDWNNGGQGQADGQWNVREKTEDNFGGTETRPKNIAVNFIIKY